MLRHYVVGAVILCLIAICGAVVHIPQTRELTVVLNAGEQRCFFAWAVTAGDKFMFGFQVRTGHTDFDITIEAPDGHTIFYSASNEHDTENRIFFAAKQSGAHKFCLDNTGHSRSEKVVAINLATRNGLGQSKRSDPLLQSFAHIDTYAKTIVQDQVHLRAREREHRDSIESSNTQILIRAFIEITVMLAMSVGQVYYLRSLFNKRAARPMA